MAKARKPAAAKKTPSAVSPSIQPLSSVYSSSQFIQGPAVEEKKPVALTKTKSGRVSKGTAPPVKKAAAAKKPAAKKTATKKAATPKKSSGTPKKAAAETAE